MAWVKKQFASNFAYPSSIAGQSLTFDSACTPGSLILVLVTDQIDPPGTFELSDTVNNYVQVGTTRNAGYGNLRAFWVVNTSSTALTVSWSFSLGGNATFPAFQIVEFVGNSDSPLDQSSFAEEDGGSPSGSVNATNAGELIVGFPIPGTSGVAPATPTSPAVLVDDGTANDTLGILWYAADASGSNAVSETYTTLVTQWGLILTSFLAASAPPSSKPTSSVLSTWDASPPMVRTKGGNIIGTNRGTRVG